MNALQWKRALELSGSAGNYYNEPEAFLRAVLSKGSKNLAVFVDEAALTMGNHAKELGKLAYIARHWGHTSHFLVQTCTRLDAGVRDQCSRAVCFYQQRRSAAIPAEELNAPEHLETASRSFPEGEYIFVGGLLPSGYPEIGRGNVFDELRKTGLFRA